MQQTIDISAKKSVDITCTNRDKIIDTV